jgi:hypothetical protein
LLGLLLALTIMAIVLSSAVAPNIYITVSREKENEMVYRGEQMARAIARYYNRGQLGEIRIFSPPQYGYLLDLTKLRDGVTIGVTEMKFVRPSAFIDPMSNEEWEPVRARDPRIRKFLDYASTTMPYIPQQMWLLAGPPQRLILANPSQPPVVAPGAQQPPAREGVAPRPGANRPNPAEDRDDDDDDDEGDAPPDPLAHLFGSESSLNSNIPIVGVAPKRKGRAIRSYFGLENYEDWVFLFIPPQNQVAPGGAQPPPNRPLN